MSAGYNRPWTHEDHCLFHELFEKGLTSGQIGMRLSPRRSANAVIGHAFRHGYNFKARDRARKAEQLPPPSPEDTAPPAEERVVVPFSGAEGLAPRPDRRCSIDGCRLPAQHNRFGLCAEHNHERLSGIDRKRARMREVAA